MKTTRNRQQDMTSGELESSICSFMTRYWVCNKRTATGVTSGAGTAYSPGFSGIPVAQSFVFCVVFC